ncbi:hypothetical protein VTI28DRAFT_9400 [Corynascus sepedonium]
MNRLVGGRKNDGVKGPTVSRAEECRVAAHAGLGIDGFGGTWWVAFLVRYAALMRRSASLEVSPSTGRAEVGQFEAAFQHLRVERGITRGVFGWTLGVGGFTVESKKPVSTRLEYPVPSLELRTYRSGKEVISRHAVGHRSFLVHFPRYHNIEIAHVVPLRYFLLTYPAY